MSYSSPKPAVTRDASVTWIRDVLATTVDGETVLMSMAAGRYYGLDAIGSDIWRRLENPVRVSDLCAALEAEYDAAPEVIARDVMELLEKLAADGLIEVTA